VDSKHGPVLLQTDKLSIYLSTALQLFVRPGPFYSFLNFYSQWDSLVGNKLVARPLPTHKTAQTQNKRTKTSMPQVGFEPTIPLFERTKTVYALDCAATVIGTLWNL
jgi:hypothetical protein